MLESIRTIIVPTDFSPLCEPALRSAADLARREGAAIHLLHAVRLPLFHTPYDVNVPRSVWEELGRNARERMYESQLWLEEAGVEEVGLIVSDANLPAETIRRSAIELEADLIVMATHGRRGVKHALLGSITERALRAAPVPVLAVRSEPLRVPPRRLLLPVDFSTHADRATEVATALARRFETHVDLLHVIDTLPDRLRYRSKEAVDFETRVRAEAADRLNDVGGRLASAGLSTASHLTDGDTADEIVATADRLESDLIVMGTHGLTGFQHAMLGSVTESTLQRARCPVLTTRAADASEEGGDGASAT